MSAHFAYYFWVVMLALWPSSSVASNVAFCFLNLFVLLYFLAPLDKVQEELLHYCWHRAILVLSFQMFIGTASDKGEVFHEYNWFKLPVVFLLTVPRWFLYYSSSLFVHMWFKM